MSSTDSTPLRSRRKTLNQSTRRRIFDSLALEASGFSPESQRKNDKEKIEKMPKKEDEPELWDDYGVVEYLEKGLGSPDNSTEDERVESMRETLSSETDIIEAHGDVTDFLFHVARTKHGRVYIRVVRTLLMNRGN